MPIKLGTKTISISFGSNLFWLPFRSARKAINERLDAVFLPGIFHRDLLKPFRATTLSLAVSSFMSSTTINGLKITFVFGYQMLPVYWMTKKKRPKYKIKKPIKLDEALCDVCTSGYYSCSLMMRLHRHDTCFLTK